MLKAYGSCVSDIASSTGYKMKNLAFKINLPNIDTYLFTALSDFGEDKVNIILQIQIQRKEISNLWLCFIRL